MATRQEEGFVPLPESGDIVLPDPPEDPPRDEAGANSAGPGAAGSGDNAQGGRAWTMLDHVLALVDDLLTYVDAELAYQKSRVSFLARSVRRLIGFVVVALFLLLLAVIGLTIGLIFALTPLVGPWAATAIVVGGLVLCAALLVRAAVKTWKRALKAIGGSQPGNRADTGDMRGNA